MKRNGLKVILMMLFAASTLSLMAQESVVINPEPTKKELKAQKKELKKEAIKNQPKVSSEFGLGVGARYNFFDFQSLTEGFNPNMSMTWSGGAALQFRLNIGRSFGFQPEISYARSTLKIDGKAGSNNYNCNIKSNVVQIPMLLSFRAAMFRFNFGPVFTLMDNATYNLPLTDSEGIKQMTVGRLYPTITYAAGISVKFAKVLMLDFRYADQFPGKNGNKIENEFLWTLDKSKQSEAYKFSTRTRSVQARFSVVF